MKTTEAEDLVKQNELLIIGRVGRRHTQSQAAVEQVARECGIIGHVADPARQIHRPHRHEARTERRHDGVEQQRVASRHVRTPLQPVNPPIHQSTSLADHAHLPPHRRTTLYHAAMHARHTPVNPSINESSDIYSVTNVQITAVRRI